MLRGGYKSGFPGKGALSDSEIEKAKERDRTSKSTRTEHLNNSTHRKQQDVAIGSKIYTRNNKRTKFQPVFDPTPRTVIEIEKGGVTCIDEGGTRQRRHVDDIKEAVEAPANPQEMGAQPMNTPNTDLPGEGPSSTATRDRKPPARYRDDAFCTQLTSKKKKSHDTTHA
jgi:hypothetical protein